MEILARAVGRRKEAVAQVQIVRGSGQFIINDKIAKDYLHENLCSLKAIKEPFSALESPEGFAADVHVKVKGGGLIGQAEAIKLGIARALCDIESQPSLGVGLGGSFAAASALSQINTATPELTTGAQGQRGSEAAAFVASHGAIRKQLKTKGLLTQDARVKERRKYGLKKARKASQYHKR